MDSKAQEKSLELNKIFVEKTSSEELENIMREFDEFEQNYCSDLDTGVMTMEQLNARDWSVLTRRLGKSTDEQTRMPSVTS